MWQTIYQANNLFVKVCCSICPALTNIPSLQPGLLRLEFPMFGPSEFVGNKTGPQQPSHSGLAVSSTEGDPTPLWKRTAPQGSPQATLGARGTGSFPGDVGLRQLGCRLGCGIRDCGARIFKYPERGLEGGVRKIRQARSQHPLFIGEEA